MDKIKLGIADSVADTLFITLYAKSVESKKNNPLIKDEIACDLVEKIDYDFSKYKNKTASSVGVAIRATHFDQQVKKFIETHDKPIVVLVGCGLDTRVQRIGNVAKDVHFCELDIEEVIEVRKKLLPALPNEEYIATSMFSTIWMDDLLAKRFHGAELHFDMLNRWMSRQSKMHDTVSKTGASFKFGIDDEKELEKWHPALKHKRTYLFNEFKGWWRMGLILTTFMSIIPVMKKSSRLLTYSIEGKRK